MSKKRKKVKKPQVLEISIPLSQFIIKPFIFSGDEKWDLKTHKTT